MTRDQVIRKVRACLALAGSSNPNEAAAAMRQAQALMRKYGIDQDTIELSEVRTETASAARRGMPGWMTALVATVADALGCKSYFGRSWHGPDRVHFVGVGAQPKLAHYAFAVLRRQLTADREAFYRTTRGKRINRVGRADQFALAWVFAVQEQVERFAGKVPEIVERAMDIKSRELGLQKHEPRLNGSGKPDPRAVNAGYGAGGKAQLNHGVGADVVPRLGSRR